MLAMASGVKLDNPQCSVLVIAGGTLAIRLMTWRDGYSKPDVLPPGE
jgi:hypothetical protein